MNPLRRLALGATGLIALASSACGSVSNTGTPGSSTVTPIPVTGTVFTIVFENHSESQILGNSTAAPYFTELAHTYGSAGAYVENVHPSLPNYIKMASGDTHGIVDDADPVSHPLAGQDNLGSQLSAANVPWRAYMESMGTPCRVTSNGTYAPKHNPFVYFTDLTSNQASCNDHVVDFEQNFTQDLASNRYRFMWITPDLCNDMHDCPTSTSETWLRRVIPQIMQSPGYQNGGAIVILFDEGPFLLPGTGAPSNLATIVISPLLPSAGFTSNTAYNHQSYLATIEDIFGMPRLPTTQGAVPMADFFTGTAATATTSPAGTGSASGGATSGSTSPSGTGAP